MLVVKKKKSTWKCKDIRDVGSVLNEEGPLEGEWQPTVVFLPGKSHGQRSLAGCRPWACNRVGHDLATKQNIHIYVWAHTQICIMYYICRPIHVCVHAGAQSWDPGLITGSRRSPGEGNANPLQYSCLGKPVGRGARGSTVHGVAKSRTRLSNSNKRLNAK